MSRNKYHMKLKVNSLGSRIIKVNSHTASESLSVHIIVLVIVGALTLAAYNSGELGFMYFGLVVTAVFLLVVLVDIYFIIAERCIKIKQSESDQNP